MMKSVSSPSDERIVDAMIELARATKSHRIIVAGSDSSEVFRELHRRGFQRVTTTKLCRVPCSEFDVVLIAWRGHSINALSTTLDWLVHFLSAPGVLVAWVGPHAGIPNRSLRLALGKLDFRIELGTVCEHGVAISARRLESNPAANVACEAIERERVERRTVIQEWMALPPRATNTHRIKKLETAVFSK
jgi:hypothetical protein